MKINDHPGPAEPTALEKARKYALKVALPLLALFSLGECFYIIQKINDEKDVRNREVQDIRSALARLEARATPPQPQPERGERRAVAAAASSTVAAPAAGAAAGAAAVAGARITPYYYVVLDEEARVFCRYVRHECDTEPSTPPVPPPVPLLHLPSSVPPLVPIPHSFGRDQRSE